MSSKKKRLGLFPAVLSQAAWFIFAINIFAEKGYLPPPFFYDQYDTFMDLFNPLYWSINGDMYQEWGSVYPPIVFAALDLLALMSRILGGDLSNPPDPFWLRDNGLNAIYIMLFLYFITPVIVVSTSAWNRFDGKEAFSIFLIYVFSQPSLFALERGNIIFIAPAIYSIALSQSCRKDAGCIALSFLINLKPYFAILVCAYFGAKRYLDIYWVVIFSFMIFILFGIFIRDNPLLMFLNMLAFGGSEDLFSNKSMLSLPSNLLPYFNIILGGKSQTGEEIIPDNLREIIYFFYVLYKMLWALLLISVLLNRNRIGLQNLLALSSILICNSSISFGGYVQVIYFSAMPFFVGMPHGVNLARMVLVLFLPLDVVPLLLAEDINSFSWLSKESISPTWSLTLGSVLRPTINFLLMIYGFLALNKLRWESPVDLR